MAGQLQLQVFAGGIVKGVADQPPVLERPLLDLIKPSGPADHNVVAFGLQLAAFLGALCDGLADASLRLSQQFQTFRQDAVSGGVQDNCIGRIAIGQVKIGIAPPDRNLQRIQDCAEILGFTHGAVQYTLLRRYVAKPDAVRGGLAVIRLRLDSQSFEDAYAVLVAKAQDKVLAGSPKASFRL